MTHPSHDAAKEKEIDFKPIVLWGSILGAALIAVLVGVGILSFFYARRQAARALPVNITGAPGKDFATPRLQVDEGLDFEKVKAAQDQILGSYGWVDRAAGTVRIPVSRAMDVLLKEGLPARKPK